MTHAKDCSAMVPCEACSIKIRQAQDARHEYNKVLEIMEDLQSTPWIITEGSNSKFLQAYYILRDLRDDADRIIPRNDY